MQVFPYNYIKLSWGWKVNITQKHSRHIYMFINVQELLCSSTITQIAKILTATDSGGIGKVKAKEY